jgi:copper homeostasis protein
MTFLEICVDSVESAIAAEAGGVQRVELCSALSEGGLTPSLGIIRAVRSRVTIGVHVMIRPRGGDFIYSEDELSVMRDDIRIAREAGADGVVLGVLTMESHVDIEKTRALVQLARPMQVTFHRAIDMTMDVVSSLEDIIQTGADRVLTSGGEATAALGKQSIREMVALSRGRIRVMAGGSVRAANVRELIRETGAAEFHAALGTVVRVPVTHPLRGVKLGSADADQQMRNVVQADDVRKLNAAIVEATSERR